MFVPQNVLKALVLAIEYSMTNLYFNIFRSFVDAEKYQKSTFETFFTVPL